MIVTRWRRRSTIYRRPCRRLAMVPGSRGVRIRELSRRRRESPKAYASPRKGKSTGSRGSRSTQSPSTTGLSEALFAILPTPKPQFLPRPSQGNWLGCRRLRRRTTLVTHHEES